MLTVGRKRLGINERVAMAQSVLLWEPGVPFRTTRGAERFDRRGGRVLMSLTGMYMDLELTALRPDLAGKLLSDSVLLAIWIPGFAVGNVATNTDLARVLPLLHRHWRDGRLPSLNREAESQVIALWEILAMVRASFQEVMRRQGQAGHWTVTRLLEHWLAEIHPYEDSKGRW